MASTGCSVAVIAAREYPSGFGDVVLANLVIPGIGSAARIAITPVVLAGWFLIILGTSLRMWCFRTVDRFFTFEVTLKDGHQLCTIFLRAPPFLHGLDPTMHWARDLGMAASDLGRENPASSIPAPDDPQLTLSSWWRYTCVRAWCIDVVKKTLGTKGALPPCFTYILAGRRQRSTR
ncbi:hypothetical protein DAEQUDRAFT_731097 [Daedalea quercina L-15889]|uniref:Uncharacterized protein n=1 Tax=Daedalea quercina L-15889 TaxID=1314783 RepID=A0A165MH64_9APHY|nr:hypothetical protein DAEQUDRAFT_731097 [Daedalea quercina L-15889]